VEGGAGVKLTYATVIDGVFERYVFEGSTGEILWAREHGRLF